MANTVNFQNRASQEAHCQACGALANPRWTHCLSCKAALSIDENPTVNVSEPILATPFGKTTAKSGPPPANLERKDWADFYEERAAFLEYDGGIPRERAERLAYEAAVAGLSWAWSTDDYPHDRCSACGSHLGPQGGLPLSDKAIVCNRDCHDTYRQQQHQRAVNQLAGWGIGPAK